jgi:hypothetical protein
MGAFLAVAKKHHPAKNDANTGLSLDRARNSVMFCAQQK